MKEALITISEIPKNSKVCIAGYGFYGKKLERDILKNRADIEIICIVDDARDGGSSFMSFVDIISFVKLKSFISQTSDMIVINGALEDNVAEAIRKNLESMNIDSFRVPHREDKHFSSHSSFVSSVIISPFIQLIMNPVVIFHTIKNLKVLLRGQWSKYSRLNAHRSFNSRAHFLYDTFMERYGFGGYCYDVSIGQSLKDRFYYSKLSMKLYSSAEALVPWFGMIVFLVGQWFLIHYLSGDNLAWVVIILTFFSSIYYFVTFEAIKYDSLGWAFVPFVLISFLSQSYYIFAFLLLIIALLSISVFVPLFVLLFILIVFTSPYNIIFLLPAFVKFLFTNMKYIISDIKLLFKITDFIGMTKSKKESNRTLMLGKYGKYLLGVWIASSFGFILSSIDSPSLGAVILFSFFPTVLFFINKKISRFADEQTIYAFIIFCFTLAVGYSDTFFSLVFLFIALYPFPKLLPFTNNGKNPLYVPERRPFFIEDPIEKVNIFFNNIESQDRIFFHFDYWAKKYPNFDGLRAVKELLQYVAIEKNSLIIPDYYLFADSFSKIFPLDRLYSYKNIDEMIEKCRDVGAKFVIFPCVREKKINISKSLEHVSVLCVDDLYDKKDNGGRNLFTDDLKYLHLFRINDIISSSTLVLDGNALSFSPNYMKILIGNSGKTIIKYIYDEGWKSKEENCIVKKSESAYPWICIQAEPNSIVELVYE